MSYSKQINKQTQSIKQLIRSCYVCNTEQYVAVSTIDTQLYPTICDSCILKSTWKAQSGIFSDATINDITQRGNSIKTWLYEGSHRGESFIEHYINVPSPIKHHVNLLEDILLLSHQLLLSRNTFDRYIAIINFCKLRGSRLSMTSSLLYVLGDIFGDKAVQYHTESRVLDHLDDIYKDHIYTEFNSQAEENIFAEARTYIGLYDKLKETAIYKKLYQFMMYILVLDIFPGNKISFDALNYKKFEAEAIKKTHKPGLNMCMTMIDTILFVCDRGLHYFKTGDNLCIFHSGHSYEKWLEDSRRLIRDSSNSALINSSERFKFLSDLKHNIEKGKGIVKFTSNIDRFEKQTLSKTLWDLESIQAKEMTRRAAQEPRKDPFAMLIHGSSSICKSQLKQILFYHYGKYFDLPVSSEYMYTRMSVDEFWTGFATSMWCVVMDDIAFLRPNGGDVDPTLKEMLQVKNSVPYCPPQASLEDKGNTPLRNELLIGTTNTRSLNLDSYFSCPFAIARRLPYILTCTIKPEFAKYTIMADSEKIPITPDGEYMNIWNFTVTIPRPALQENEDCQRTKYHIIERFSDINDMLAWYITMAKAHNASQEKALAADSTMMNVSICKKCYRTSLSCNCENNFEVQNEENEEVIIPSDDIYTPLIIDDVNIDDYSQLFKFQLWCFSKILAPENNPTLYVDFPLETKIFLSIILLLLSIQQLWFGSLILTIGVIYYVYIYLWFILSYVCMWRYGDLWKLKLAMKLFSSKWEATKFIFRLTGDKIYRTNFSTPQLRSLKKWLIPSTVALIALWKSYTYFAPTKTSSPTKEDIYKDSLIAEIKKQKSTNALLADLAVRNLNSQPVIVDESETIADKIDELAESMTSQANEGVIPVPMEEEKPSFYYHDPYQTTEVDITQQSSATPYCIVEKQLIYNTARIEFVDLANGRSKGSIAINIKGQLWLVNNHSIDDEFNAINMIFDPIVQNVSRNCYRIAKCARDFTRIPNTDLCIFELKQIPPGHNLYKYLPKLPLEGCYKGKYNLINKNGERSVMQIDNIRTGICPVFKVPGHFGYSSELTVNGNCGAMCLVEVGSAPVLFGMHTAGNANKVVFFQDTTQPMLAPYVSLFSPQVSCGTFPISAPGYERKIGPVDNKSHIRWIERGHANIMGNFMGWRAKIKSKVSPTFICESAIRRGYKGMYGPPNMTWKPWSLALTDMTNVTHTYDTKIIQECVDSFTSDILHQLGDKIKMVEVYTQDVALNGVDGITYVDMLNTKTSAGNPFKKSKKSFIEFDENNKIKSIDPIIQDRINDIEDKYSKGERFNPQFCAHIKDDPTTKEKYAKGKSRIFTGGEFAWSVVVRKYCLSLIRLIQNNPEIFEAMPGIVAQSTDWEKLFKYITTFGIKNMIAGDYGKFDKKMVAAFILAAFDILIGICKAAGWSEMDLMILRCIAYDTAFSNIDFNGTYIMIQGNPSGHPLTVIINCLVNSLYIRYAFKMIYGGSLNNFYMKVKVATYGDDNILNVHPDYHLFNHTSMAAELKKIGVEYTMADKTSESIPFIHIDQISFLKRSFRFDEEVGAILAPLESSSFDKMMTSRVIKSHICSEAHSIAVIETALREYFFYGRKIFEEKSTMMKEIISENNLDHWVRESTFPTFDTLCVDFWTRSGNLDKAKKFATNSE
nr:MAG: hypothetical protein 1 [Marnaviridae sp.]